MTVDGRTMDLKLELVVIPVSDVDRAKAFYTERVGFNVDHDSDAEALRRRGHMVGDTFRVVQLTPPGSACSIALGVGILDAAAAAGLAVVSPPGSLQGLQLVVLDIQAARARLVERGVDVSDVQVFEGGSFRPSREGDALDNVGFVFFSDPDGNGWAVQQISARE
jgi:catechol 2,3-dioxygenase-like lactoylglutathione lyase family enzyme